jgi:ethanolamine utilization protein EutN
MELGRVMGTVVASRKDPGLAGIKLLVVQPLHEDLSPNGDALVMADAMQAGPGEIVWFVLGREAALALPKNFVPVDFAVVGIADRVDVDVPANRGASS